MEQPRVRFGGIQTSKAYVFELTGGRLCLDFANTLDERETGHPRELLRNHADLIDWAVQAGAVSRTEAGTLRDRARRHPRDASNVLEHARTVRETIFGLFSSAARGRSIPPARLVELNCEIPRVLANRRVERAHGRLRWVWRPGDDVEPDLERILWPVVLSAAELLTSAELERLRQCEGEGCAWLFMDTTKSRTRRWCDMSVCGNRAKARRFYARSKGGSG